VSAEVVARTRRTNLVSTFGVGALLPTEDDSVMICGLSDWNRGDLIIEPRLAASLGIREFRSPSSWRGRKGGVPAVRFPEWAFCPQCRRLGPWWKIADREKRRCNSCGWKISPSRFVACCVNGHIEDFPYLAWVHKDASVRGEGHDLKLIAEGHTSALKDLVVQCTCGRRRSLDGAFDASAFRGIKRCSGSAPWLGGTSRHQCDEGLRTLQRGSSNVWFAVTRSTISIPSVIDRADRFVESKFRDANPNASSEELAHTFQAPPGCTEKDVRDAIDRMRNPALTDVRPSEQELRAEEYRALVNGSHREIASDQFLCEEVDIHRADLPDLIEQVSRVGRLREVRALTGFTRVLPFNPGNEKAVAPLVEGGRPEWLPAVEVLGEGIFIRLGEDRLQDWVRSDFALEREGLLLRSATACESTGSSTQTLHISVRSLALHSLAHVLLGEMSLTGGYPTASLRERIYDHEGQAGILIYTASADSAGSLGGLAAQSDPHRFSGALASGIRRARWCSADPVCIESMSSGANGRNLAACHCCLLVPETSCEKFNTDLDRGTLIGLPDRPAAGLFGELFS
jgi:hypothetical protein